MNKDKDQLSQQLLQIRQKHFQQQHQFSSSNGDANGNLHHQQQQPSSLPPEVTPGGVDLQRLRELRRVVREECEQLLARKEMLQQDVVLLARQINGASSSSVADDTFHKQHHPVIKKSASLSHKRGSLDFASSRRGGAPSSSVSANPSPSSSSSNPASSPNSAPATSTAMSPAHAFSSLAKAYKVSQLHSSLYIRSTHARTSCTSKGQPFPLSSINFLPALLWAPELSEGWYSGFPPPPENGTSRTRAVIRKKILKMIYY